METYPGIPLLDDRDYRWCIMLRGSSYNHLREPRSRIGYDRPTEELAGTLNDLVGKGNWMFQTMFNDRPDFHEERMALWFRSESDMLAVRMMLIP